MEVELEPWFSELWLLMHLNLVYVWKKLSIGNLIRIQVSLANEWASIHHMSPYNRSDYCLSKCLAYKKTCTLPPFFYFYFPLEKKLNNGFLLRAPLKLLKHDRNFINQYFNSIFRWFENWILCCLEHSD